MMVCIAHKIILKSGVDNENGGKNRRWVYERVYDYVRDINNA